jgi:hypothetical protein
MSPAAGAAAASAVAAGWSVDDTGAIERPMLSSV